MSEAAQVRRPFAIKSHVEEFRGDLPAEVDAPAFSRLRFRIDGRFDPKSETLCRGVGSGRCLRPFLTEGDVVWWDSAIAPKAGDLVATTMLYRKRVNSNVLGDMRGPEYAERFALKQLQIVDGEQWLCCADGSVRVPAGHKIIGVVCAWQRKSAGWFRWRVPMRRMNFQPDARRELATSS